MSAIEPHTFHSNPLPLSSLLAGSRMWERTLVPIEPAVRVTAVAVAGLIGLVVFLQFTVLEGLSGGAEPGYFLFGWTWFEALLTASAVLTYPYVALLVLLAAAAMLTEGFSIAGRRVQRIVGGLVIVCLGSLVLPLCMVVLALANLVAWVVVAVLVGAAAVAALFAFADS